MEKNGFHMSINEDGTLHTTDYTTDGTNMRYSRDMDADGFWSHKRGHSAVERFDYSKKIITDPYIANRKDYLK